MDNYWAVCPKCGADINYSSFRYEDYDENVVHFRGKGHCKSCDKHFTWEEHFSLCGIDHFEEIDAHEAAD